MTFHSGRLGTARGAGVLMAVALLQAPAAWLTPIAALAQTVSPAGSLPAANDSPDPAAGDSGLPPQEPMDTKDRAVLQGLDKITARVFEFEAPIGEAVHFGSFVIVVQSCTKTPPEEPPESTAFLEITDVRPDQPFRLVFKGWMFASSPALSAVEHPVYDVWVTGCRAAGPEPKELAAPGTSGSDDASGLSDGAAGTGADSAQENAPTVR